MQNGGYSESGGHQEPVVWQLVEWRQGDGRYRFEVQQGGLHATLTSPHGQSLTIPMVAWYGLIDALAASRKTRERSERPQPPRSHARWTRAEIGELLAAYHSGATIRSLAQTHNRSEQAIEAQLSREGLWDRLRREPIEAGDGDRSTRDAAPTLPATLQRQAGSGRDAPPWPSDYWDSPVSRVTGPAAEAAVAARADSGHPGQPRADPEMRSPALPRPSQPASPAKVT